MNTNHLKKFAQEARIKLLDQVSARMELVLTGDSAELRERSGQIKKLQEAINSSSRNKIIDQVAYTWFNRFMALRFMDVNGYQPINVQVVTPKEGHILPELLDEAKQGYIPEELQVDRQHIHDVLDGKVSSTNAQNEAYKELLIGACNHLHTIFPFLFERISDFTELLLPEDLISEFSILQDVRDGMTAEDCEEVEIVGWLYQFYISEVNDELITSKKKYRKEDLAPASQLFTPKWIVQYMVDNTLGQLWSELYPNTKVTDTLDFYITPAYKHQLSPRPHKNIEDIKFFEPCVGSGHILAYAFDVFYKMYEEQGYNPTEIPGLIITKNLFGVDLDQRAAQLASFVLVMKGRQKHKRFLRIVENKNIRPNISYYEDFEFDENFKNAAALGSLITISPEEAESYSVEKNSLFSEQQEALKILYDLLGQRYDVVVTNPPYISSSRMEGSLKQFVNSNYPETKSDLFATFILRCLELCNEDGLAGYMTPFVWMFISSYQKLREIIIDNHFINNLIQLEYSGFDGATVPVCTFTLRQQYIQEGSGSYIRLSDFKGAKNQAPKTLEAIQNPDCGWFYTANQKDFQKIPGSPIGYWLAKILFDVFEKNESFEKFGKAVVGLQTGDNERFLRFWYEVELMDCFLNDSFPSDYGYKWYKYNKAGSYRKWFGNLEYVVNWRKNGDEIRNFKNKEGKLRSRPQNTKFYFKQGITWSDVTSGKTSFRHSEKGTAFDTCAATFFPKIKSTELSILGILNNKVYSEFFPLLNPTIHFKTGNFKKLPYCIPEYLDTEELVSKNIKMAKEEWSSRECFWNFQRNQLLCHIAYDIEETYDLYRQYWQNKFYQLHSNEEELNKQFIEIYGLQDELIPDVPLEDITILQDELKKKKLKKLSDTYRSGWELVDSATSGTSAGEGKVWKLTKNAQKPDLPFDTKEVMAQFVSYAVGCMFGRYSLDKEGLILANQGETNSDFVRKVLGGKDEGERMKGKGERGKVKGERVQTSDHNVATKQDPDYLSFLPDDDNIIPVLDEGWFEDDIVGRFKEFLKMSFGEKNYQKNLAFLEECLGRDIRNYFIRDFYKDHIKRYKKRPIYWMFSSPKGSFNVLIYMHRYTPDSLSQILNNYLVEFREKLKTRSEHLDHVIETGSATDQTKAAKEQDKIKVTLLELQEYEWDILYPLATERIAIDLDDGVLVNYNKFGQAIKEVKGLNDKKKKARVKKFDWIDGETIR